MVMAYFPTYFPVYSPVIGPLESTLGTLSWDLPESMVYQPNTEIVAHGKVVNQSGSTQTYGLVLFLADIQTGAKTEEHRLVFEGGEDTFTVDNGYQLTFTLTVTVAVTNIIMGIELYTADPGTGTLQTFVARVQTQLLESGGMGGIMGMIMPIMMIGMLGMMMGPMMQSMTEMGKEKPSPRYPLPPGYYRELPPGRG